MKKNFILALLLLFLASSLIAQTQTTVFGNLGVENVNISIVNTPYGTSSDAKGHYELPLFDRSETVNLYYSCIGYQDTLVSLTPKQLQRDSINVSFRMRKMSYDLQEVGVSAYSDFYRSGSNRNIADIAFLDGKIYLLENKPKTSSMVVLDTEGVEQARKDYDQLFEKLHIDAFDDLILVGKDSCLQVYLDEKQGILPVSTFSREDYRNKLLKIVCEYNGAYIVKTIVHDRGLYWLKFNHGKSQDFYYVMKDGSMEKPQHLCSFIDTVGYRACQSQWMSIQNEYHQATMENDGIDLINLEIWDGNLMRLAETSSLISKIQWYCSIMAKKEYQIIPMKVNGILQFADLDNREIVEIGPDFKIAKRQPLKITSGEKQFQNEFLTDKATGKTYGLFIENGMNYVGLYDPEVGTVGMGQKASKKIYPRVFKVHGGYAYSVFFDSGSNRGVISRVKIG
ncbi:MAG: carboxypeptidase-like regulatory domain-containing protein [Bacteroidales bacterium]|nr:carboxypeptidase-like regulatory domain-containing protein [Bacteroidales bacterium]